MNTKRYTFAVRTNDGRHKQHEYYGWAVAARTPEDAWQLFCALVLFPEPFVDPEWRKMPEGYDGNGLTGTRTREYPKDGKAYMGQMCTVDGEIVPGAMITVWVDTTEEERLAWWQANDAENFQHQGPFDKEPKPNTHNAPRIKVAGRFPYRDAVEVTAAGLVPEAAGRLLGSAPAPPAEDEHGTEIERQGGLEVSEASGNAWMSFDKRAARSAALEIAKKREELALLEARMGIELAALEAQMKDLGRKVYLIQTFLGTTEEVHVLQEGAPAPAGTPLSIYQAVLYMDEETGLYAEDGEHWQERGGGLDYRDLAAFDAWAVGNLHRYVYRPLSVCAFRVRRHAKDREGLDALTAAALASLDSKTYLLIRNGDRIFRIWSDIPISGRLFPGRTELADIIAGKAGSWDRGERAAQERYEHYLPGVVYLQGLIERSDVLGTHLQGAVNLLTDVDSSLVEFVRDAEAENWIDDGRPRWKAYAEANRKTITTGCRVVVTESGYGWRAGWKGWENDTTRRTGHHRSSATPARFAVHTIAGSREEDKSDSYMAYPHHTSYKLLIPDEYEKYGYQKVSCDRDGTLNPNGHYERTEWVEETKTRRVSFYIYESECLNFDTIRLADAEYYLNSRLDRPSYAELVPTLQYVRELRQMERDQEAPFIDLIRAKVEATEEEVWAALDWWKLKNKWKRALQVDDAKAYRMIVKELRRRQTEPEDPSAPAEDGDELPNLPTLLDF